MTFCLTNGWWSSGNPQTPLHRLTPANSWELPAPGVPSPSGWISACRISSWWPRQSCFSPCFYSVRQSQDFPASRLTAGLSASGSDSWCWPGISFSVFCFSEDSEGCLSSHPSLSLPPSAHSEISPDWPPGIFSPPVVSKARPLFSAGSPAFSPPSPAWCWDRYWCESYSKEGSLNPSRNTVVNEPSRTKIKFSIFSKQWKKCCQIEKFVISIGFGIT